MDDKVINSVKIDQTQFYDYLKDEKKRMAASWHRDTGIHGLIHN